MSNKKAKTTRRKAQKEPRPIEARAAKKDLDQLSPRQQIFVKEYLRDLNATQAAIRAGYNENTARQQGSRMLTNVDIARAIQHAHEKRVSAVGDDADSLLSRLLGEANADLADLFDENFRLRPISEWPIVWRQGLVAGIETETLRAKGDKGSGQWHGPAQDVHEEVPAEEETVITKIKLSDRIKRLELIGRHHRVGAWKDRVKVEVSDPLQKLFEQIAGQAIRPNDPTRLSQSTDTPPDPKDR